MPVVRFDHASVPTDHPEEMMAFYERMGFTILDADAFLSGERRIFSIAFGDNKMNVHGPDFWPREDFTLRGPPPRSPAAATSASSGTGASMTCKPPSRRPGRRSRRARCRERAAAVAAATGA